MKLPLRRAIKRFVPARLFARALLILLLPTVLLQLVLAYQFYERHWDSVVRNMSSAVAGDITALTREYRKRVTKNGPEEAVASLQDLSRTLGMRMQFLPDGGVIAGRGRKPFPELYQNIRERLANPVMIESLSHDRVVRVRLVMEEGALQYDLSRKRLASSTTYIFMGWMVGSALLLTTIAVLFLRNQVRPIVQLARAAEQFGLGREVVDFAPRGASEIKRASSAFLIMADRIRRSVQSRTEMLAGISHDLRTPLTRMKLEMEMGKIDSATRDAMNADIDEMRRMIDEYLDFARGDAGEPMAMVDLAQMVADVVEMYARQGQKVKFIDGESVEMQVRPNALRRALTNLIDNALRYGNAAKLELDITAAYARIKVTDKGPGIPEDEHETVFKPFTRLDPSRNINTGGVGLGLSIARDIALGHGGDITLENQRDKTGKIKGLEVTLRLPRAVHSEG